MTSMLAQPAMASMKLSHCCQALGESLKTSCTLARPVYLMRPQPIQDRQNASLQYLNRHQMGSDEHPAL